tara:strand:- start:6022 stop:6126 length:105 start_codon:yes stop_codon:yes gene_type:complete
MWDLATIKKMNTDKEVRRLAKIARALNKGKKKSK